MRFSQRRAASCAALAVLAWAGLAGAAAADDAKTYTMKISLPTLHDTLHQYGLNYAAAVEKDSGGRIKAEVYPASQLGAIPRQIEGTQFGAIQCVIIPPEFMTGVDERFEVMTAPGLVSSMAQGQRLTADPQVLKLMLGLGADKGLRGAALFLATPSSVIARAPIRHLADFKGKKIRIFSSQFQTVSLERLGATPVAMTLGDVLPAIQQGTIDGAVAATVVYATMHYADAAKYVTETGQPYIFLIAELSKKWYATLPKDLQAIVDRDAQQQAVAINGFAVQFNEKARQMWQTQGGELIELAPSEQAAMMKTLQSVGADVAKSKPKLDAAYQIVTAAAKRAQ